MLLQAKPEVLSDENRVEGGPTNPNITKNYSFGELESEFGFRPDSSPFAPVATNDAPIGLQKAPWLFIKQQVVRVENARTLTELGVANQLRGQHARAVKNLRKALMRDEEFVPAYKPLFNSLLALGKHEEALECLSQLATLLSDDLETQHELVLFKMAINGKSDAVKQELLQLLHLYPDNAYILNSLGIYYLVFEKDGASEAIKFFEKSRAARPEYAPPVNNLGACYEKLGNLEKSEIMFSKAIKIDPAYVQAWENLANIQIKIGHLNESLKTVRKALENNVQLSDYWQHQEGWLLIQLGKPQDAIQWYEDSLRSEPNNPFLLNNLGYCYELLRKFDVAKTRYTSSLQIARLEIRRQAPAVDARLMLPFYNIGRLLLRSGKTSEVKKIGEELLAMREQDSRGLYFLGTVAVREKEYLEGEKYLLKAIEADRSFIDSYIDLSFVYISIYEDFDQTIKLLKPLIQSVPEIPPLLVNNYCDALIKAGHLKKAEQILAKIDIPTGEFAATKGLLKLKQGDVTAAKILYEKAIKSLEGPTKEIAKQTWLYEHADHLRQHSEPTEAVAKLKEILTLPESYVSKWAEKLLAELNKSEGQR